MYQNTVRMKTPLIPTLRALPSAFSNQPSIPNRRDNPHNVTRAQLGLATTDQVVFSDSAAGLSLIHIWDISRFIQIVGKYSDIQELTYENVHEFIDRILIHELDLSLIHIS